MTPITQMICFNQENQASYKTSFKKMAFSRAMLIYIMLTNEMRALATGHPTKCVSMSNKYHIKVSYKLMN